jgi:hypothetical protein
MTTPAVVIKYLMSASSTRVTPETSILTLVHEEKIDPTFVAE